MHRGSGAIFPSGAMSYVRSTLSVLWLPAKTSVDILHRDVALKKEKIGMKRKKRTRSWESALVVVSIVLMVAAILDQLRMPPEQRTWHGEIAGVPYDFRMPTRERLRAPFWNKEPSRILVPKAFAA